MAVSIVFLASVFASLAAAAFVDAHQEDATQWAIDIGTRSYNETWWFCVDKKDRPIPAKYATLNSRKGQSFDDLLENERPAMRTLKNGAVEPDVLDDGNAWVAFNDNDGQRIAYIVSSEGFHPVFNNAGVFRALIPGSNYLDKMPYKTRPLTLAQLDTIAREVGAGKAISDTYKGTDFVIELVLAVTDDATQQKFELRKSSYSWPSHLHLLDAHYHEFFGRSAFEHNGIAFGAAPPRVVMEARRHFRDIANRPHHR